MKMTKVQLANMSQEIIDRMSSGIREAIEVIYLTAQTCPNATAKAFVDNAEIRHQQISSLNVFINMYIRRMKQRLSNMAQRISASKVSKRLQVRF